MGPGRKGAQHTQRERRMCFTQIHPTCILVNGDHQSKLTIMSGSLCNVGRIRVPVKPGETRNPQDIPATERDSYMERAYPSFGNLVPRDVASRVAKNECDAGRGVGPGGRGVRLDLTDAMARLGRASIEEMYGNLLGMYQKITAENPYLVPLRIYPAVYCTMVGPWVYYYLES